MKTKNIRIMLFGIACIIALTIGAGIFFNTKQATTAHATEVQNTELKVTETRIDGWRAFRDMTALRFRPNAKTLTLISVGLL